MNIDKYSDKINNIQKALLLFLEDESSSEEHYQNLQYLISAQEICSDKSDLALFLHLISSISENHHRGPNFNKKIKDIISQYLTIIKNNFTNFEIFNIFKHNKIILLFLLEEKVFNIDENIAKVFISAKYVKAQYPQYFAPEIKVFMNEKWFPKYEEGTKENEWINELKNDLPENFYELRKEGENENYICKLIRNDSIEEFVAYTSKNNYPLQSKIPTSIFETNSFLTQRKAMNSTENQIQNNFSLIEYAVFFGSIKIVKFLQYNQIELTPQLWLFSIHSQNGELIHLLEENEVTLEKSLSLDDDDDTHDVTYNYKDCLEEAIKCHHNDIVNYFLINFFNVDDVKSKYLFVKSLKYFNFSFLQKELIDQNALFYLSKYDYFSFIKILANDENFDVNKIY